MKKTVKPSRVLCYLAALLWTLAGLGLISVAFWFRGAEGATTARLLIYLLAGLLFVAQAFLVLCGTRLALILPVPMGLMALVAVLSETVLLIDGTLFSYAFLIGYSALFLLSALTLVTVGRKY